MRKGEERIEEVKGERMNGKGSMFELERVARRKEKLNSIREKVSSERRGKGERASKRQRKRVKECTLMYALMRKL